MSDRIEAALDLIFSDRLPGRKAWRQQKRDSGLVGFCGSCYRPAKPSRDQAIDEIIGWHDASNERRMGWRAFEYDAQSKTFRPAIVADNSPQQMTQGVGWRATRLCRTVTIFSQNMEVGDYLPTRTVLSAASPCPLMVDSVEEHSDNSLQSARLRAE